MSDPPPTIFISYAHTDSPFVDRLEADLRQQGFAPWVDRQRLAGGQRWRHELQEAVERAQVLLIVLSPEAVASTNVQIEYDYALEQGKVVIPLYYRPCNVPMELRAIQRIDFRESYEHGLAALLPALPAPAVPPTRTSDSQRPRPRTNLPLSPTPLIGRQQEIQALAGLLLRAGVNLVTLTGIAGIGKTRLALQVATDLAGQFPDGIFLVALAPISDAQQVVLAILQTLAISDSSGEAPLARLASSLQDQRLLLLLDNFEQVVEAAVLVAALLTACPQLKVLVTSREVLRLQAEHEFVVPPLALPNPKRLPTLAALAQYEAVALFLVRAQAAKADFALTAANAPAVATICARLDGLPLAIELAAARSKYFSPQVLLSRLEQGLAVLSGGARDLPARQQTLRGALAWSYELLTADEQRLFRRLAVCVDGCTWQAAERVCTAASPLPLDILEGLVSLVDKSLLRQDHPGEGAKAEDAEPRFSMLQTLREFGLELLAAAGETPVTRQAHADYYLPLAQEAEPHLYGAEQATWLARLEQEHENLRAALAFLLPPVFVGANTPADPRQVEQALRGCVALTPFWSLRGYFREGLAFLEQALATSASVADLLRAKALLAAAELAFFLDDLQRAETLCTEGLPLFRTLGDKVGMADALFHLATSAWARGQFGQARPQLEEAAAFYQELGDRWKRGRCLTQLARVDTAQGQYEQAHGLLEESLALYRALGDTVRISWVLYLQARLLFLAGRDAAAASRLVEQSLTLSQEGEVMSSPYALVLLGQLTLQQGEQARARDLFEESRAICKETGDRGGLADALMGLASVAALQGDLVGAYALYQESLVHNSETDYQEGIAPALEGLAAVEAQQSEFAQAARLWGAAEALRKTIGAPIPPVERAAYERMVEEARRQAQEQAFAAAWAEGDALPLEQLLAELLKSAQ